MSYKPRESGPFAGLKLIDADSHITEPTDLWTKRAPAKYKDRVPQTGVDNSDGKSYWWVDADKKFGTDSSIAFVRKNGKKIPYYGADMMGGPRDDIHAAASEAKPRVELLDQMGIYTQIVYPNVMGFAAPALVQNLDRELSSAIVAIYNDAMAEWQEESGRRLLPQAVLPFWDIEASVKEAARAKDLGLTGVCMAGEPHLGGLPDLGMPHWDPLYEALSDLELPIDIHIGASNFADPAKGNAAWASLPQRAAKPVRSIQTELANSRFISNLCASDLLIRWPKLNTRTSSISTQNRSVRRMPAAPAKALTSSVMPLTVKKNGTKRPKAIADSFESKPASLRPRNSSRTITPAANPPSSRSSPRR